jgi:hypothetical protein
MLDYLVGKLPLEGALNHVVYWSGDSSTEMLRLDMMRLILAHHACVDSPTPPSALLVECTKNEPHLAVMTLLLEHGARLYGNLALETLEGRLPAVRLVLDWRQARRLWVLRSAHECKRVATQSALRILPREMTRMVGDMLGEEDSGRWDGEDEEESDDDDEEGDGGY